MEYQQQADRLVLEAGRQRKRKEEERDEKLRKEYQEFFLELAQVLNRQTEVSKLALFGSLV